MGSTYKKLIPESAVSPYVTKAIKQGRAQEGIGLSLEEYHKQRAMLESIEKQAGDEKYLSDLAKTAMMDQYSSDEIIGMSQGDIDLKASYTLEKMYSELDARKQGLREGLEEYERVYGLPDPEESIKLGYSPADDPIAPKYEGQLSGALLWALSAPGRAVSGAAAGAIKAGQEAGLAEETPNQRATRLLLKGQETRYGGLDPHEFFGALGTERLPLSKVLKSALEHSLKSFKSRSPKTHSDLTTVLEKAIGHYREKAKALTTMAVAEGRVHIDDDEAILQHFDGEVQRMLQNDPAAAHPEAAQLLTEIVLDPSNVLTPFLVFKAMKRIPGVAKIAQEVKAAGLLATKPLRHMTQYDAFRLASNPKAREVLDTLEHAEAVSDKMRFKLTEIRSGLDEINSITRGDPGIEKLLYEAASGQRPAHDVPHNFRRVLEINKELNETAWEIGTDSGLLQKLDPKTGKLGRPKWLEERVPRRLRLPEEGIEQEITSLGPPGSREKLEIGAKFERVEEAPQKWVPSISKQWEAELGQYQAKVKKAIEVRETRAGLQESTGHVLVVDRPLRPELKRKLAGIEKSLLAKQQANSTRMIELSKKPRSEQTLKEMDMLQVHTDEIEVALKRSQVAGQEAKALEDGLRKELDYLQDTTGVPWKALEADSPIGKIYTQVAGTSLDVMTGNKLHLLPEAVHKNFKDVLPALAREAAGPKEYLEGITKVLDKSLVPLNAVFRRSVTLPFPAYTVRNATGALLIGAVGLKFRMFNPRLQARTANLVSHAAGLGSKKALGIKATLESKEVVTHKKLLEMAMEDGVIGQFDTLMKAHQPLASKLDVALGLDFPFLPGPIREVTKRISPKNVNNAVENYQSLLGYLGFLKGTSRADRGKALRMMSDYMGNYKRMSPFEKNVLSEVMPFYAWNRFVMPWFFKRLADSPAHLGVWKKLYDHNERQWGEIFPVGAESIPKHMQGLAWTMA
jgi:hypothetical protein